MSLGPRKSKIKMLDGVDPAELTSGLASASGVLVAVSNFGHEFESHRSPCLLPQGLCVSPKSLCPSF